MHAYQQVMNGRRVRDGEEPQRKAVRWTADENQLVALLSYEYQSDPAEPISSFDAVNRAQFELLAPERQRAIRQTKNIEALVPIWASLKAAERAAAASAPDVAIPLAEVPAEALEAPTVEAGNVATVAQEAMSGATVSDIALANSGNEPSKERKAFVRWTDDEKLLIARESKRLRAGFTDMSVLEAIRKAVFNELPADRQRTITTMSEVKFVPAIWQQIDAEAGATEQRAIEERWRINEAEAHASVLAEAKAQVQAAPPNLSGLSFEALIKGFAAKVGEQLMGAIGEHIQEAVMRQVVETLQGVPLQPGAMPEGTKRLHLVPRERPPRLTVVGLINQQEADVRRAFPSIEFVFIKSQQQGGSGAHGGAGMLSRGANSDVVISMTDFTGHDVDKASKHLGVPFVRLVGSVSALKRWIGHWLNGEVALAGGT